MPRWSNWLVVSHVVVALSAFQFGVWLGQNHPASPLLAQRLHFESALAAMQKLLVQQGQDQDGVNVGGDVPNTRNTRRNALQALILDGIGNNLIDSGQASSPSCRCDKQQDPSDSTIHIPPGMGSFMAGFGRVKRDALKDKFDVGVPWEPTFGDNREALMIYTTENSLPDHHKEKNKNDSLPMYRDIEEAVRNCGVVKIVLTKSDPNQCLAVVSQFESHHIYKWMRGNKQNKDHRARTLSQVPLQYYARGEPYRDGGQKRLRIPEPVHKGYDQLLSHYLDSIRGTLDLLKPVAAKAAGAGKTVVVMVCKSGQSELLINFVCAAQKRNLDVSHILVFATDHQTYQLARLLNLHAVEVQGAFGPISENAVERHVDKNIKTTVMTKLYAAHLINAAGYDMLFQDVDIVWYKDPLPFFENNYQDFDMIFQDDGPRDNPSYGPYYPNSGMYFVRHNVRTEHFYSVMIRMGDLMILDNDKLALATILNEHVSLRGLRAKVLSRDDKHGQIFPSGFHYHRRLGLVRKMIQGDIQPYLFHMNWASGKNKKVKLNFFRQMGDWFVQDTCVNKHVEDLTGNTSLTSQCCSAAPLFQCHYRDRPSQKPCKESPAFHDKDKSFW